VVPLSVSDNATGGLRGSGDNPAGGAVGWRDSPLLIRDSPQVANKAIGFGRSRQCSRSEGHRQVRIRGMWRASRGKEDAGESRITYFEANGAIHRQSDAKIPRRCLLDRAAVTGQKRCWPRRLAGEAGVLLLRWRLRSSSRMFVGVAPAALRGIMFKRAKEKPYDHFSLRGRCGWRQRRASRVGRRTMRREQTSTAWLRRWMALRRNSG